MKLKNSFFYTIRENIKDEESRSGNLLVRSGMIKKSGNGIYMYLPLGFRVIKKIEKIIREEMNKSNAQELLMPCLIPEDIYIESGRRDNFGDSMFGLKDRYHRNYVLGPTHEELFTIAASMKIKSYKDMPFNIYQMATKFRDEPRPRYGLIRVREFIMKDAYSFDLNEEGLDQSYKIMYSAYEKIFDRVGLNYKIVKADTGTMGGTLSEEFQAITDIGEDAIVLCEKCGYASNLEVSECAAIKIDNHEELLEKELQHTPNAGTIEDVSKLLDIPNSKFVKTLIYEAEGNFYAVMCNGNRDINELKLERLLNVKDIALASFEDVERITNAQVGFAGPIELNIPVVIDNEVLQMKNFIVGANKTDHHYINVNIKDFDYKYSGDIVNAQPGDPCPKCGQPLIFKKGIEIGNIFKLGTKYSKKLGLEYLDQNNQLQPVVMGCYGIGVGRIMAAVVEQQADDNGIKWPINIAPYQVAIVIIDCNDESQNEYANKLYDQLNELNIDTILDDRNERIGVKFNDIDLIGIPIRIVIGKKINQNIVEFKLRDDNNSIDIDENNIIEHIKQTISNLTK